MGEIFQANELGELADQLRALGAETVLLISGPSRRFVDRALEVLEGFDTHVFDRAEVHVPRRVVAEAQAELLRLKADAIVSLGGGAATGLAKALRLSHRIHFVAVPTTYSGSEVTELWGMTSEDGKQTGRDERVRPDIVLYDPGLTAGMPAPLTVKSVLNALAHPISALSVLGPTESDTRQAGLDAIATLFDVLGQLTTKPSHVGARLDALRGAADAARVLDRSAMGVHHEVAHALGGKLGLEHAGLHSVLLPQFLASLKTKPELSDAIAAAARKQDPASFLFEALRRVGASTSLRDMNAKWTDVEAALASVDVEHGPGSWIHDAYLGRRPSNRIRRERWDRKDGLDFVCSGPELEDAERIVIAVHGRGSTAERIQQIANEMLGDAPDVAIVAPQGNENRWYSRRYREPELLDCDELAGALALLDSAVERATAAIGPARVFVFGFSQGACLALEYAARSERRLGGVIAIGGSRLGDATNLSAASGALRDVPVLVGVASDDPWLVGGDVERSAENLAAAGARVEALMTTGDRHEVSLRQRIRARELIRGRSDRTGQAGFGNAHASEDLPGALPTAQNSPRHAPYGLYAEQINGTGFAAPRADNRRAWLYRIRPSAGHRPFGELTHPTLTSDFRDRPAEANLVGFTPLPIPEAATDFVDGLHTLGGAGDPALRRGFAVHLYAANRSMEHRSFYDADGELLLIPELGGLTLATELGVLDVQPGQVAIVPRGLKLSVLLVGPSARGYVAEVFGRHFVLPERGPIGANCMADARHFVAPTAWHEDRIDPGHRLTAKLGGRLLETTIDHSPYDVAAWHGNDVPHVYDLSLFSPVSTVRIDHVDPSVYTVLSAPLDEQGSNSLDFVIFPPRWDPTEHTFRPPFFHRNATTEFNGIIREVGRPGSPFEPGLSYLTPSMTAHGVVDRTVEHALDRNDDVADRPYRLPDRSLWFQFETALPMSLSAWAEDTNTRIRDWDQIWGHYRTHFDPRR